MSLGYKLRRAAQRLDNLPPREAQTLQRHVEAVHRAEHALLALAETLMDRCIAGCQGLC